jgi:ATP-dependent DNA helicase DinG
MRGELVAIDLETTGLDTMKDAIIEVGAVKLRDGEIVDEFATMVNPGRPIPSQITHITGIRDEDIAGAPLIDSVLPQISAFAGTAPVIAHNISHDMGFLRYQHGILKDNARIDTYELASVLLPRAPRYNLNSLTQQMGISLDNAHRALSDARATALLYWALWQKTLALPRSIVTEIDSASRGLDWDAAIVFAAARREQGITAPGSEPDGGFSADFETAASQENVSHQNHADRQPKDVTVSDILGDGGLLTQDMPGFEYRPQQLEMAQAISKALSDSKHLMAESGTGTGKSIAYLVPAILHSIRNNERVVISTNTIALQDQLISKDIPELRTALGIEFSASVMKGRANYLCPRRLETVRRRQPSSAIELRTLAKIMVWLLESSTGDRGEISLRGPVENTVWQRLSAQDEGCTANRCQADMRGICPFFKARQASESANLIIVNHALLISDANSENRVLPDYRYVVIDEAHQLEDAVTNGLSIHIDQTALIRRLADLGGPNRGLLGDILSRVHNHAPHKTTMKLEQFIQQIGQAASMMEVHIQALFAALSSFLEDIRRTQNNEYVTLVRIGAQEREKSGFSQVQSAWATLDEFIQVIGEAMLQLTGGLQHLKKHNIPDLDELRSSAETAAHYLQVTRQHLNSVILSPDNNTIYWLSLNQGDDSPVIHTAPLHIGPLVEQHLWHNKESVILTSATLRTQDNFDFIRNRLYADSAAAIEVGSPFNYRDAALIYLPTDIPEPTDRHGYQRAVERGIIELATALDGRVLVLFTSYSQLRQTAQAIAPRLALGDIVVYDQSDGTSRQALLDGFKSGNKAVLLGTRSFWEGVDIPGATLSALVIVRLPFSVPSDPIFAARSETYRDTFSQYALPDAILRFRQGFGRLIRTDSDRGVVTIFDSRIIHKGYGAEFLASLPDCTNQNGPLDKLPEVARNWIGDNR